MDDQKDFVKFWLNEALICLHKWLLTICVKFFPSFSDLMNKKSMLALFLIKMGISLFLFQNFTRSYTTFRRCDINWIAKECSFCLGSVTVEKNTKTFLYDPLLYITPGVELDKLVKCSNKIWSHIERLASMNEPQWSVLNTHFVLIICFVYLHSIMFGIFSFIGLFYIQVESLYQIMDHAHEVCSSTYFCGSGHMWNSAN